MLNIIRKYIRNKRLSRLTRYYIVNSSSILQYGFNLRLDNPDPSKIYLTIGSDCIISGNFIFESKEGRISIGDHTYIGGGTFISRSSITIGNNVTIAWGGTVYDHDSHSLNYLERRKDIDDELRDIRNGVSFIAHKNWECVNSKPIVIQDDVWIGMDWHELHNSQRRDHMRGRYCRCRKCRYQRCATVDTRCRKSSQSYQRTSSLNHYENINYWLARLYWKPLR